MRYRRHRTTHFLPAVFLAVTVFSISSTPAEAQFFGLSKGQEIKLGKQMAKEVERTYPILRDLEVQAYIDALGQDLVRQCKRKEIEYRFKVINTEDVNAFALPGGYIYINRGLIETVDNESELAGVIAHEIGHVVGRHHSDQVQRTSLTGLGLGVLDAFLGSRGGAAQLANLASQMVASGAFMKFSRDAEREADRLGARNVYDTGYDPEGMVTFFERLDAMRGSRPNAIGKFFATHPSPNERAENISDLIRAFPAKDVTAENNDGLIRIQRRLTRIPVAKSR
jgi:predicted Zn-dependent protease